VIARDIKGGRDEFHARHYLFRQPVVVRDEQIDAGS